MLVAPSTRRVSSPLLISSDVSPAVAEARRDRQARLAALLFVLSGLSALIYQVAWQRILALHSGVGLYSVSVIVAAFLAGLGLGSHLGGVASARVGPRRALAVFAVLEFAIGVLGALSPYVYYDWLYPLASPLPSPSWAGGALHFAALIPPTLLMGASLPFLVRATVTSVERAGTTVGVLYGCNLLGAALGAAGGTWLLMPTFGIRGAIWAAAVANLVVGAGAWALLRVTGDDAAVGESTTPSAGAEPLGGRPLALWLVLYGLSGFVALSLEILWFRVVDVAVKSTAFTFGTVLAIYLLGNAAGCLFAAPRIGRLRRPLRTFLLIQCAVLAYSAGVVIGFAELPHGGGLAWYERYWSRYGFFVLGHEWDPGAMLRLYGVLPLVLFGPPTFLMGIAFPVLQRAVHDDPRSSGRKVGYLQAANILGCVLGALLVGLLGLEVLGTTRSLQALVALGLVFVAIGEWHYGRSFAAPGVVLVLLVWLLPGQETLWRRLHGVSDRVVAFFKEDATGVVAVTPEQGTAGRRWRISVNGKGNSWFPFGGVHTALGAVPVAMHPSPRDVAIVGLGSGDTAWGAASAPESQAITVFELSAPQPDLLRRLAGADALPDLQSLLDDPRIEVVVADGRKALVASDRGYDVIEADAILPSVAYSGNLYSVEFFEIGARRLKPGGLMCTWAPTPRVRASFCRVFPHVVAVGDGDVLLGSNEPIAWEPDAWRARLQRARAHLGEARYQDVARSLSRATPLTGCGEARADLNHDLFPRDEFAR